MKRWLAGGVIFFLVYFHGVTVLGSSAEEMMGELDFTEISSFLEENDEVTVTFEELMQSLLKGGEIPYETIGDLVKEFLLSGFAENKQLVLMLLVIL